MEQYKRFEANPSEYKAVGAYEEKMCLTKALVDSFISYSGEMKMNSKPWVARQRCVMLWWAEKLKGLDLHHRRRREPDAVPHGAAAPTRTVEAEQGHS